MPYVDEACVFLACFAAGSAEMLYKSIFHDILQLNLKQFDLM
jgi:hypothetical protein